MLSYGHLVYDFGTVKNRGTEKKEPNRPGTESGTETGTVPSLARVSAEVMNTVIALSPRAKSRPQSL